MANMEAAASLFGSDDAGSDPFASLGNDNSDQGFLANTQDSTNSTFYNANEPVSTADQPQAGTGTTIHQNAPQEYTDSQNGYAVEPQHSAYNQPAYPQQSSYFQNYADTSHPGAARGHGSHPGDAYRSYAQDNTVPAPRNNYTPDAYLSPPQDPYPQTVNAPSANAVSSGGYGPSAYATGMQSTYSQYQPSQTTAMNTPSTQYGATPSAQQTYNQYAPPNPHVSSQSAPLQPYTVASQPPPPPKPIAPVQRPRVNDAYDPPFSTSSRSRKASSRVGTQTFSSYGTYQTPLSPQSPFSNTFPGAQTSMSPPPPRNQPPPPTPQRYPPPPQPRPDTYGQEYPQVQPPPSGTNYSSPYLAPNVNNDFNGLQDGDVGINHTDGSPQTVSPGFLSPPPHPGSSSNVGVTAQADPMTSLEASEGGDFEMSYPTEVEESSPLNVQLSLDHHNSTTAEASPNQSVPHAFSPPSLGSYGSAVPRVSSPLAGPSKRMSQDVPPKAYGSPVDRSASPALVYALNRSVSPGVSANTQSKPAENGSTKISAYDTYIPGSAPVARLSPPLQNGTSQQSSYDYYSPSSSELPGSSSLPPPGSNYSSPDPYHPSAYTPAESGSVIQTSPSEAATSAGTALNSYSPAHHRQETSESSDYGMYTSRYDYPYGAAAAADPDPVQELTVKPALTTISQYAPSPSLMGTNDPLERTSKRIPVFSFGFGGKLVTCFHGSDSVNTGFDVAFSSRNATGIHIRSISKVVPDSALKQSAHDLPGPLFGDKGSMNVLGGAAGTTRKKKEKLLAYLTGRAEELSQGVGYMHFDSTERRQAEGKLVLVKLLKVMVENDGRLSGTMSIDKAVRTALVPRIESEDMPDAQTFAPAADFQSFSQSDSGEAPVSTSTTRKSTLDKIQDFLHRGERRQAYHYALDEKLWAHAMVIASSIDREAWKEVVNEFLKSELGVRHNDSLNAPSRGNESASLVNGFEGLRVAYSLYSGQGASSVKELIPPNLLAYPGSRLPLPTVSHLTPMTPNFAAPSATANVPSESLSQWAETLAMMYSSPVTTDTSAALTAFGDQLLSNGWVEAAHVCYLLAPQTSVISGLGNPSTRVVLLGSPSPQVKPNFANDPEPGVFTEIAEYAYSLATPAKGQEPYRGMAHLQAYKYIRAMSLAEVGEIQTASKYCEAIHTALNQPSPYFSQLLVEQLRDLSNRIAGVADMDKSKSWNLGKPSLDSIGGWFGDHLTKLVTGESEAPSDGETITKAPPTQSFSGPFAHYSAISSTTTSTSPSPAPQAPGSNYSSWSSPSQPSSASNPTIQIDRASSATDYSRRKASPIPRIASANAVTTTFAQASSYSPEKTNTDEGEEDEGQEVTWWGSNSYGNTSAMPTPTVASFTRVQQNEVSEGSDGLISLMDGPQYSFTTANASHSQRSPTRFADEDEEDLGFGNRRSKTELTGSEKAKKGAGEDDVKSPKGAKAPERPDIKPTQGAAGNRGSWFGSWFRKTESTGPVKASLGEETSFYYDKDLKKWVNKKVGEDSTAAPAAPPPPPSRAQTASPGMVNGAKSPSSISSTPPPPARAASVTDMMSSGPPPATKSVMRIKSNLVPSETTASAPGTPTGSRLAPEAPPLRPRSSAARKPRYAPVG